MSDVQGTVVVIGTRLGSGTGGGPNRTTDQQQDYDSAGGASDDPVASDPRVNCVYEPNDGPPYTPPDNAQYAWPKQVPTSRINEAIGYLSGIDFYPQKLSAFYRTYNDPDHPYYLNIKTLEGPNMVPYFSDAAGATLPAPGDRASAFEPFGNYVYGLVGALGGITPNDLRIGAAFAQEGGNRMADAPEDKPHVDAGIAAAYRFAEVPGGATAVEIGPC